MTHVEGFLVERIDDAACKAWLDHVLGCGAAPAAPGEHAWVLCHCDGGVTWGRREDNGWLLGSKVFPDLCPEPSELELQELRIFSTVAEVLIWREEGGLRGRILRDSTDPVKDPSCSPDDENRLLVTGVVRDRRNGFTRVVDGTGAEQALPLNVAEGSAQAWPRLRVRHYFGRDEATGAIRVVASRLVEVK